MRFALLGDDLTAVSVARAVVAHSVHRLIRQLGGPSTPASEIPSSPGLESPGLRACRNWEELLTDAEVDAVIVGGRTDECQPVVRQLVQAGKAVLVAPQIVQSTDFFYELALVESESPGRIFPMLALRGHPLVLQLQDVISQGELGNIRHVQVERKIASEGADARAPVMSQAELASALLIDADLLQALCGSHDQVTASRSGDAGLGYSLATVMLAGPGVPQAVWTATAHAGEGGWRLVVSGDSGRASLDGNSEDGWLRLTLQRSGLPEVVDESCSDAGMWLLEEFSASMSPQADSAANPAGHPEAPIQASLWGELARTIELLDAVERSVRRRRTIDVYFETPSERGIFKTQMTAVGCSLIVLTLAAVVCYLVLAATVEMPLLLARILMVLIFAPLAAFLALQFLVFVARPARRDMR
jgi:predicted dehydrogenase